MAGKGKRIDWLDITKFIAISLMVWLHAGVPYAVDSFVHVFHMPVFFIVSGWCFNEAKHTSFGRFLLSRAKMLLVPYLFWAVILYAGWNVFYLLTDPSGCVPVAEFVRGLLWANAEISPFASIQWFLTCMFFSQLISWLVIKLCRSRSWAVAAAAAVLAALGWALPFLLPVRLPLSLDVAVSASAFYLLGWLAGRKIAPALGERGKKAALSVWTLLGCTAVGSAAAIFNGYVNMRIMSYGNPLLFYLSAVLLSFALMRLSGYIEKLFAPRNGALYRLALYIGRNTLLILMLNQLFIKGGRLLIQQLPGGAQLDGAPKYAVMAVLTVVSIAVMAALSAAVNRLIPFSVGQKRPPKAIEKTSESGSPALPPEENK